MVANRNIEARLVAEDKYEKTVVVTAEAKQVLFDLEARLLQGMPLSLSKVMSSAKPRGLAKDELFLAA